MDNTATVGNVKSPRPGIFDMLGRAKWYVYNLCDVTARLTVTCRDAWAKHKDIPPHEAKLLYVETLLKVLFFLSEMYFVLICTSGPEKILR